MKIALDARMLNESGIGRYIRNLIKELQKVDSENEYFVLLLEKDFNSLKLNENFKKVLADIRWYGLAEQIRLPSIINKLKPDLVHFPHFNVPIFFKGKFVVTIHDLIHQHFQMRRATLHDPLTYKVKQIGYKVIFKNAIKKSEKILVPSNYVKNLLTYDWGVKNEKIVVTPEAVDDKIIEKSQILLKRLNIRQPYIFYVGNAHPHKNVEGLIRVFRELRGKYQYLQLVLAGGDHYFWQRVRKDFQDPNIIYTGTVSDEELVALYKGAKAFVMPSFEEGFGIPLLEAMACGCPVVSSNAGALQEVGGNAAIYFDPHNLEDMIQKISQALNSENLRKSLIEKGKQRVKLFSWEKLARQTLEVYHSV